MTIHALYICPVHNFYGHHGKSPGATPMSDREEIVCRAGRGIEGDRFWDYKPDYKGQITFFEAETHDALVKTLGLPPTAYSACRRNVITRGIDLASLIGEEFEIQGVRFSGSEECKPCYWMDHAFQSGAEAFLQGRGGLRARILSDGILRPGPALLKR